MNRRNLFAALFAVPVLLLVKEKEKDRSITIANKTFRNDEAIEIDSNKYKSITIVNCVFKNTTSPCINII